ncbi:hypothetical protein ACT9D3_004851 [Salmonella enterica subsp. diarizonae serovar 50:r:z]
MKQPGRLSTPTGLRWRRFDLSPGELVDAAWVKRTRHRLKAQSCSAV